VAVPPDPEADGFATRPGSSTEPYQSLYRRYRPVRFSEVRGQEHVTRVLVNAVRDGKVAHAYLFSGPRGTGKTSTARILAMALNCAHPEGGEPDVTCPSCVEVRRGASLDVHELDAASNRKLDEMRDLLSRVALGTRGRWKVYIIDEVHQLTPDAASALLKTLEEPPAHVVFVLATTDPQRVLPTIRSRTQHLEFRLLSAEVLGALLHDVNERASLGVPVEAIDLVVRRGHGSARDALSVLDQVAAAGAVEDEATVVAEIVDALADRDAGRALVAVAEAMGAGRDPRRLAVDLLEHLRNGFLATQARSLVHLADDAVTEVEEQARRLGLAALVRAMEVIGDAAVDMRDSVDPRVTLEVALVRLAAPGADRSVDALVARIERMEGLLGSLTPGAGDPSSSRDPGGPVRPRNVSTPARADPSGAPGQPAIGDPPPLPPRDRRTVREPTARAQGQETGEADETAPATRSGPGAAGSPPSTARSALGAHRRATGHAEARPADPVAPLFDTGPNDPGATERPERIEARPMPSRDELTTAWGDVVLPGLRPAVKVYFSSGRFVDAEGSAAVYALPDQGLLSRAERVRDEAEEALSKHFGAPVRLRLVLDGGSSSLPTEQPGSAADPTPEDLGPWDLDQLAEAEPTVVSPEQRLLQAFPGSEEVIG
jgi:DNA polymerase-3 subunit gamma/tau